MKLCCRGHSTGHKNSIYLQEKDLENSKKEYKKVHFKMDFECKKSIMRISLPKIKFPALNKVK